MGMWDMLTQQSHEKFLKDQEDAAVQKALLLQTIMSKKDFNDQAQVGFWDKAIPWDTANERADALNRQAMALQPGGTEQMANDYYNDEARTWGAKWIDNDFKIPSITQNKKQQSIGNVGQGMQDLGSKYFGEKVYAGEMEPGVQYKPIQNTSAPLSTQQTELGNNLPSSLKQPDNISSFWDYLKNKQ